MPSKSQLGHAIRAARERHRWTQADLGTHVGVDRKTVDNWENGRTSPRNRIGALEEVLGIDLRDDIGQELPDTESDDGAEVIDAILRTGTLIDEAREHLLNQYELLRRLSPPEVSARRSSQAGRRATTPPGDGQQLRAVARGGDPTHRGQVRKMARQAREQYEQEQKDTGKDE